MMKKEKDEGGEEGNRDETKRYSTRFPFARSFLIHRKEFNGRSTHLTHVGSKGNPPLAIDGFLFES